MTGCYGNHPEDRAREHELNQYLDGQCADDARAERVAVRAAELYAKALNDEAAFNTLNDDYESITGRPGQLMRVLRNLDSAIKEFNDCHAIAYVKTAGAESERIRKNTIGIDAVFTALSIIQDTMKAVCDAVAEGEISADEPDDSDAADHYRDMDR